jgi:hypothetical protein
VTTKNGDAPLISAQQKKAPCEADLASRLRLCEGAFPGIFNVVTPLERRGEGVGFKQVWHKVWLICPRKARHAARNRMAQEPSWLLRRTGNDPARTHVRSQTLHSNQHLRVFDETSSKQLALLKLSPQLGFKLLEIWTAMIGEAIAIASKLE